MPLKGFKIQKTTGKLLKSSDDNGEQSKQADFSSLVELKTGLREILFNTFFRWS
jgi:hypothetical protein